MPAPWKLPLLRVLPLLIVLGWVNDNLVIPLAAPQLWRLIWSLITGMSDVPAQWPQVCDALEKWVMGGVCGWCLAFSRPDSHYLFTRHGHVEWDARWKRAFLFVLGLLTLEGFLRETGMFGWMQSDPERFKHWAAVAFHTGAWLPLHAFLLCFVACSLWRLRSRPRR